MAGWPTLIASLVCAMSVASASGRSIESSIPLTTRYLQILIDMSLDYYKTIPDTTPYLDLSFCQCSKTEMTSGPIIRDMSYALLYLSDWLLLQCAQNDNQTQRKQGLAIGQLYSLFGNNQNYTVDPSLDRATDCNSTTIDGTRFGKSLQLVMFYLINDLEVNTSDLCTDCNQQ
ncbi:uncharacterized protein [Apostichopus japonicus]|uniref:uncharacterized protein n=1 Tax=Stichopus japonicus TaxID=307972 RepID=UPI003AB4CDD9